MKEDVNPVKIADTANANEEVVKLALVKACNHLRELVGINNYILPYLEKNELKDIDLDGYSWMIYFIAEAAEELGV